MKTIIAEKPSVAREIARIVGATKREEGYFEGLRNLEAGDKYDNLYLAAKARSESDWLVGINGTQALSIGRVQTPTLAMVCARYWENRRFTVEPFWQLHIAADDGNGEVVKFSSSEKWKEKEPATELYNNRHSYCHESRTQGEDGGHSASVRPDHAPEGSQCQARLHGRADA